MILKKGDRVKIIVKSYQKDHPGYEEWGIVDHFEFSDTPKKSYDIPDTVSVKKDKFGDTTEYCLDTGHQYVWGQGMTGTTAWERIAPEYLPITPILDSVPTKKVSLWQRIKDYVGWRT
jgi:hypothetical protein